MGRRVYLDGPYGAFTIGHPADMHVLIAGGIGVTPMMSMIRTLADRGDKRPVILLYASKDWESITFREDLETLKARLNLTIIHVLQNPPTEWTGERGSSPPKCSSVICRGPMRTMSISSADRT